MKILMTKYFEAATCLGCDKPDKVIDFLEDNARVPSLYDDKAVGAGLAQTPLKPLEERFPKKDK